MREHHQVRHGRVDRLAPWGAVVIEVDNAEVQAALERGLPERERVGAQLPGRSRRVEIAPVDGYEARQLRPLDDETHRRCLDQLVELSIA